jgi:hypothetical protein
VSEELIRIKELTEIVHALEPYKEAWAWVSREKGKTEVRLKELQQEVQRLRRWEPYINLPAGEVILRQENALAAADALAEVIQELGYLGCVLDSLQYVNAEQRLSCACNGCTARRALDAYRKGRGR